MLEGILVRYSLTAKLSAICYVNSLYCWLVGVRLAMTRFKLVVLAVLAIAVFWFLISGANKTDTIPEQVAGVQVVTQTGLNTEVGPKPIAPPASDVVAIDNRADFFDLEVGQMFSVKGDTKNSQALIVLDVISKSVSPTFTLITASTDPGFTSVITVTDSLTNILVKTPSRVFEYSGDEFNGVVDLLRDLNLGDDIHFVEPKEILILDDVLRDAGLERFES
jgi:hypothetical protein